MMNSSSTALLALLLLTACKPDYMSIGGQPRMAFSDSSVVYHRSECIGAVVNGECHGSVMPRARYHETCYGEMLGGRCTGAQF